MPDPLVDNVEPTQEAKRDPDVAANASGGPEPIPTVNVNRSTVAELERRRILKAQAAALSVLATAAVLTLIYFAKLILIVALVAVLLAFVLAPIVDLLDRQQVPRGLASFLAVSMLVAAVAGATYVSYSRAMDFMQEVPHYKARINKLLEKVRERAEQIQQTTETVLPSTPEEQKAIAVKPASGGLSTVLSNAASFTDVVLAITFVPFLVFFMLSWQDHVRAASVMLFNMENRNTAYVMLGLISRMIRSFIVGNLIIGLILSVGSIAVFGFLGLPYFYFLGLISGFLSLIPYLGVILAIIPPLIADLGHLNVTVLLIVTGSVLALHLFGMNVLYPKMLGKRLQLNPLAVTLALLFWGWLWGAMGLVLAVPLTGAMKIICDHVERLRPYGAWMGE